MIKLTYYLDVISSWCFYFEPAWSQLKEEYAGKVEFEWDVTLIPQDGLPKTAAEEDWYYKRSGTITKQQTMLNSAWFETHLDEYMAPNAVAVAAKELGVKDDRVRLAIARAGMVDGLKIGRFEESARIGAQAGDLNEEELLEFSKSEFIDGLVRKSTAKFHELGVTQRPAFELMSEIDDRAVFSGLIQVGPLKATMDAMISDVEGYRAWGAHMGSSYPGE